MENLLKEAKRILFADSVHWTVREEDEKFINLLYVKEEQKRGLLSTLIFLLFFGWLLALLFSNTAKKWVKKQITLTEKDWKLEINWDLDYVKIAYKTLNKVMWDKISQTWWVELLAKKSKFIKKSLIWVFIFFILMSIISWMINWPTEPTVTPKENISNNEPISKEDTLKIACQVIMKDKTWDNNSTFENENFQNTYQNWKEYLITWNILYWNNKKSYACYFDKEDKLVEAKFVN